MILQAVEKARNAGARLSKCAQVVGVDTRTLQRWESHPTGEDGRAGPKSAPGNRLSDEERKEVLSVLTSAEFRDLSPKQVVPKLADRGLYFASESTMYRLLREAKLATHRGRAKPRTSTRPNELVACGPNQVWSWDITYLKSPVRGIFYYLYMIVDVWSRKIVGSCVHESECGELASTLMMQAIDAEGASSQHLHLHQDNGGPMKGATLKATLEALGVIASYSRPRVSDDNPYSEALFRTLKYRPDYPTKPFCDLAHARSWAEHFVSWYNGRHLHSSIGFVTPHQRHQGDDLAVLESRKKVYESAKKRKPMRWSKSTRNWKNDDVVILNPAKATNHSQVIAAQAA